MTDWEIRTEASDDAAGIRAVHEAAFAGPVEADIVDALRDVERLSLVAVAEGRIVGHVLFTPAVIRQPDGPAIHGMALAPLAVLPEWQRRGIGTQLIERGLATLRRQRCPFVIVLGHADYYPRFGFQRASQRGIACQWRDMPDEAFMLLPLDTETLADVTGVAYYHDVFDEAVRRAQS